MGGVTGGRGRCSEEREGGGIGRVTGCREEKEPGVLREKLAKCIL